MAYAFCKQKFKKNVKQLEISKRLSIEKNIDIVIIFLNMPSVVHTFVIDRDAEIIKKSERITKFYYSYLFAVHNLWNKGIKFITAYKHSCLPQTIDKFSFAGNVANIRFVIC
jgi:hypothetical protein